MPNAITLLKSDHATVRRLLRELEESSSRAFRARERLVGDIERELKVHSQIEEEIFYPAFKNAAESEEDDSMFYEAAEEHHVVDLILPELKNADPKSEQFAAKATVLKEIVEHHAREEERDMFPRARKLMSDEELRELGDELQARKEMLIAAWGNPLTRPIKKIQAALQKRTPSQVKSAKSSALAKARA
jgi:hemerythrin-like domain-containing protein